MTHANFLRVVGRWAKPLPYTLYFWQAPQWKLSIIFSRIRVEVSTYASCVIVFASLDDLKICDKTSLHYRLQYLISKFSNQRFYLSHFQYKKLVLRLQTFFMKSLIIHLTEVV